MNPKFKAGDYIHFLAPKCNIFSKDYPNNIIGEIPIRPVVGEVLGFDKEGNLLIKWPEEEFRINHLKDRLNFQDQCAIWNGLSSIKKTRKVIVKQRKAKKRFDVGTLVKTSTSKSREETGIITNKDGMEIYFQIYLQKSMAYVWREYDELSKI